MAGSLAGGAEGAFQEQGAALSPHPQGPDGADDPAGWSHYLMCVLPHGLGDLLPMCKRGQYLVGLIQAQGFARLGGGHRGLKCGQKRCPASEPGDLAGREGNEDRPGPFAGRGRTA